MSGPNWERPDEQLQALMGRGGELPPPGNNRWGNSLLMTPGQRNNSYTFVQVGMDAGADYPTPMAIAVAFSLDGQVFTPAMPAAATNSITFTITKAVDVKAKIPLVQVVTVAPGDTFPFCTFLARGVTVVASIDGETGTACYVQVTVAPTTMVDCGSVANPVAGAYSSATSTRLPATHATVYHQAAQPTRVEFFVQNRSSVDLFVSYGTTVNTGAGTEEATVVLPGGVSAVHEDSGYQGEITLQFAADDAAGYALLTTGAL